MPTFLTVWLAQTISMLGSQLSGFALGVWLFQKSGGVTLTGLAAAATWLPQVLGAPLAGVLTDRFERRRVLVAGHLGAGSCSLVLLGTLRVQQELEPWLALGLVALASCFRAVEMPAFSALTTELVPTRLLGRANGLAQLTAGLPQLIAPAVAGILLSRVGLGFILGLDVASFVAAVLVLSTVRMPARAAAHTALASVREELAMALGFVRARKGLLALIGYFALLNVNLGIAQVATTPLVLGFADAAALGEALSIGGLGMLVGALLMAAWGGPRRGMRGVIGSGLLQGVVLMLAGAEPSFGVVATAAFGILFAVPLAAACTQTIWQRKVPVALQGRVFSLRILVAGGLLPFAQMAAGPLCDRVFEPAMRVGGPLSASAGAVLGSGPGRGAALLLCLLGVLTLLGALLAMTYRPLWHVEDEVPDAR